jgi:hypothetical protein
MIGTLNVRTLASRSDAVKRDTIVNDEDLEKFERGEMEVCIL